MKKLNEVELMDILDEKKTVDALHEKDMTALDDAKLAMMALQAWEEAEPVQAREDFWPRLREQLPERPPRSPLRRMAETLGAWVWPAHSPLAASMRVAMIVGLLALASFWFAPQQAISPVVANFTAEEKVFIERSLRQHDRYITTGPSQGGIEIPAGDATSAEIGDGDPGAEYLP